MSAANQIKARKDESMKMDLLLDHARVRREILETVKTLPLEKQDLVFLGAWSMGDLLAHLSGWDETNLAAINSIQAGQLPEFYAYRDHDWQTYNARLVRNYHRATLGEQISLVEETHKTLLASLQALPGSILYHDFGVRYRGYHVTIARLIESEVKDENIHLGQIVAWMKPFEK